jgi:O-succinylbenzoic acid--CoA ligase
MDRALPIDEKLASALGIDLWKVGEVARQNDHGAGAQVIREASPPAFLEQFFAAVQTGHSVWIASPNWGAARMQEMATIMNETSLPEGSIMIPTGGTSGALRFALHTWETLAESAEGFGAFYRAQGGLRTLCVLPTFHVSGLMQAVRVAVLGGSLVTGDAHDPQSGLPVGFKPEGCCFSLVPTQLRRLLDEGAADWLRRFRVIIIGGAALDEALANRAREERLPLSPSYGMTETAAVACALMPEEFLAGKRGVGRPLPHVTLTLGEGSRVHIRARSLCKQLVPSGGCDLANGLLTNDIGTFDQEGILHILRRADRVIISGGEKIDPGEVEAVILATGLAKDAYVIGFPSREWGEAAAALYVSANGNEVDSLLHTRLRETLSPAHVPKKWVRLDVIPRTSAGKPDVSAIQELVRVRCS